MLGLVMSLLLACSGAAGPGDSSPIGPPADDTAPSDSASTHTGDPGETGETGAPESASALVFDGDPPTNLLLISIDTLRPDRLARYGGPVQAPALHARMAEGVVLDDLHACSSWTYAGMLCVLSGLRNTEMGFVPAASLEAMGPLPEAIPLAADRLADAGFFTSLVTTTYYVSDAYGTARGYEAIRDLGFVSVETARPAVDEALLELPMDRPWFLHVHLVDPHAPYEPPDAYRGAYDALSLPWDLSRQAGFEELKADWPGLSPEAQSQAIQGLFALYDGEIEHLDSQLGEVWDQLESSGALDDALVVVVSDHGEQFYERGDWEHGKTLYGEELEALGFFWSPRLVAGAWDQPTSQADLIPTALHALGLDPGGHVIGGERGPRHALKADAAKIAMTAQSGSWKLHYIWSGEKRLYDLSADPDEQTDRYDPSDPTVAALWDALLPEVERVQALLPGYEDAPVDAGP